LLGTFLDIFIHLNQQDYGFDPTVVLVHRHEEGRIKPPAPMLSFGAKPGTASILIPDHTHWGNEGPLLAKVSDGMGIQGWDRQHQYIKVTFW